MHEDSAHLVGGHLGTGERRAGDREVCGLDGPVVTSGLGSGAHHHVRRPGSPCRDGRQRWAGSRFLVARSLIGRIGSTGRPFFVGSSSTLLVEDAEGPLFLGVNDYNLSDNWGAGYTCIVTRARPQ
jgi:hypothetical protein